MQQIAFKTLFEYIIDNLPVAMLLVNSEGCIVFGNREALKLIDLQQEDFSKTTLGDIFTVYADENAWEKDIELLKTAQKLNKDLLFSSNGLNKFYEAELQSTPVKDDMIVVFLHNKESNNGDTLSVKFDELKMLNEKLVKEVNIRRNIEENLKEYSEELKAKNLELEQFAYVASHDLQEPLRMISSFTQLLARKIQHSGDKDTSEFIRYILDGASRMQRLINDLLIYSRIGRKGTDFGMHSLTEIIENAKENLTLPLDETDTKIIYTNLPEVYGDKGQLVQLVQNLISNAIKFRKKDALSEITVMAEEKGEFFHISVADNGIGFNIIHQERIFNIFQRLHSQHEYSGTGIGLAICKKIVERHGGEIWAESEEGKGSVFHFTLKKN